MASFDNQYFSYEEVLEACLGSDVPFGGTRLLPGPSEASTDGDKDEGGKEDDMSLGTANHENGEDLEARALYRLSERKRKQGGRKTNLQQMKRMRGDAYLGFEKSEANSKHKRQLTKLISKKVLGQPCSSTMCRKSSLRHCNEFSEKARQEIFDEFWKDMDWKAKRVYVRNLVDKMEPRRRKVKGDSRRGESFTYYLKLNGQKKTVCKKMFQSTLGIDRGQLWKWLTKSPKNTNPTLNKQNESYKRKESLAISFLQSLPMIPSHYCRSSSAKFYLQPDFTSTAHVYEQYKKNEEEATRPPLSKRKFYYVFNRLNIGIFQPKKDQCDICIGYQSKNVAEDVYQLHKQKKESARTEKLRDKDLALDQKQHLISMDLQAVKLAPSLNASSLYYKTKLAVHNFTIYNSISRRTWCYIWDESEGELEASIFATCLIKCLETEFQDDLPIVIFSDGCTYQNRNCVLSNALLNYAVRMKKTIIQKYLERGHTQMEVDSVHATIERALKGKIIYLPTQYADICSGARKTPEPYKVQYLRHNDFLKYSDEKQQRYSSIRPGKNKAGEKQVTDLRQLKYHPSGRIDFKLDHGDDWKPLPGKPKRGSTRPYSSLYSARIPISKRKFDDLQDILPVIPKQFHSFYQSLPHK